MKNQNRAITQWRRIKSWFCLSLCVPYAPLRALDPAEACHISKAVSIGSDSSGR